MLFFKIYLQFSQFFLFTVYCLHAHYLYCHKSHEQKKYILIFALCFLIYIYIYILFWNVLHFSRRYCWCEKQKWLRSVKESRNFREFAEHRGVIIKSKRLPWNEDDSHQEESGTFVVCYMSNKLRSSKNRVCYTRK